MLLGILSPINRGLGRERRPPPIREVPSEAGASTQ